MYQRCNWAKGVIYQIYSPTRPRLRYVGATAQDLKSRFLQHLYAYNRYVDGKGSWSSSFKVLEEADDVRCILLESFPCGSRRELEKREREHIKRYPCVNCHYNGDPAWKQDEYGNFLSKYAAEESSPNSLD